MIDELLESGQYQAALSQLNDMNDEKTRYYRLVCLNALEEYKQAKAEGAMAKASAKETYYDVVAQYLTALKECEDYEEAIDILIEELSMPYIPMQYEGVFNAAYDEILLAKQEANQGLDKSQIFSIEEIEVILKRNDVNVDLLYMALDQLQQLNVRMIMSTIRDYLQDPKKEAFAKSLIMEIMIEQQVDEELEVEKFGSYYTFNPSYSALVLEREVYMGIGKKIEENLEDENPSLMNQCIEFLEYYLYAIYPREIYEEDYSLMAATIHYYVATLQAIEIDKEDLEISYNVDFSDVEKEILALKQIEC